MPGLQQRGQFILAEFGHHQSGADNDTRDWEYIRVAPGTALPVNAYRSENLGTGQVRLNYTSNQVWEEIEWARDMNRFYDYFAGLVIKHYLRVRREAQSRIPAIEVFQNGGYPKIRVNVTCPSGRS